MRLSLAIAALSCAMLPAACAPFSAEVPVPVNRRPDPSLLLPCRDPVLIDDPETASDNDVAAERIRVAEAYLACKRRQADLAAFVSGDRQAATYGFPNRAAVRAGRGSFKQGAGSARD